MNIHSRRKSFLAGFLAVLMLCSVSFSLCTGYADATSSSTIRKKINNLEAEANTIKEKKESLEAEISSKKAQSQSTIERKGQIDQRIEITRLEIENTNQQIQEYNLLIDEKQKELDSGLLKQSDLNTKYKIRIRAMEENGTVSYWAIIFHASSFGDFLDRVNMIAEIARADRRMLDDMEENNKQIAAARMELETVKTGLQSKVGELDALQDTLSAQKTEAEGLIIKLSAELSALDSSYEELESQEGALRQQIIQAQQAYEAALSNEQQSQLQNDNAGNAAGGGTSFLSPLPKGSCRVTDAYGYRTHPLYGYYAMHHGVDLAANHGTKVYAIASGYVNVSSYANVNGNYISISHGNGYGSLYAHLDYSVVSPGEYVSAGQVIGYVGSTGWSSGPHLHFEIHKNGATVNPMQYISI